MRRKSGFTLIELLVVVAIIALLIAILLPSLGRAREQALTVRCGANLKQYGIALRMYLETNQQKFPSANAWLKSTTGYLRKGETPDGVMWPYLSALGVHMCPTFSRYASSSTVNDTAVSYCFNSYVGSGGAIWNNWLGAGVTGVTKETQVYSPASVVMFTEENTWTIPGYSVYPFNDTYFTVGNSTRQIDNFATFHNSRNSNDGGANAVFLDGHVELLKRFKDLNKGFRAAWPKSVVP